jgi:hypothetical protein
MTSHETNVLIPAEPAERHPAMTAMIVLAAIVLAVVARTAVAKAAVRLDGYGRRTRPPSSRWPDIFDPPRWHSPRT